MLPIISLVRRRCFDHRDEISFGIGIVIAVAIAIAVGVRRADKADCDSDCDPDADSDGVVWPAVFLRGTCKCAHTYDLISISILLLETLSLLGTSHPRPALETLPAAENGHEDQRPFTLT